MSEPWPHSLVEQRPRSELTRSHTFGSGVMSKSDRLPSVVSLAHSVIRFSSSISEEVSSVAACCRARCSRRVQR